MYEETEETYFHAAVVRGAPMKYDETSASCEATRRVEIISILKQHRGKFIAR